MRRGKRRKKTSSSLTFPLFRTGGIFQFVKELTNSTKLLQVVSLKRSMIYIGEFGKSFISPELARIIVSCISSPSPDDRHASKADPPFLLQVGKHSPTEKMRENASVLFPFFLFCGGEIPSSRQGETGREYEVYYGGGGGGRNNASLRHLHYRFQRKIPRRGKENEKCFFLHLRKQHKSAFFLPLRLLFQGQTNENPFLTFLFGNPLAFSLILIEIFQSTFLHYFCLVREISSPPPPPFPLGLSR